MLVLEVLVLALALVLVLVLVLLLLLLSLCAVSGKSRRSCAVPVEWRESS